MSKATNQGARGMLGRRQAGGLATAAILTLGARHAGAQEFPNRPITLVVPAPPGGANDTVARLIAPGMSAALGQSVVIVNLGGAGGNIASERVARAEPDGHTVLIGFLSSIAINPFTYASMPVDPLTELAPVALAMRGPLAVAVHPELPVRTLAEFAVYVRKRPGELNYGSSGAGGATHVGMALICQKLGLDMVHVPYRGSAPAQQDLVAGRLAAMLDALLVHRPLIEGGRLRGLAVTGEQRVAALPDIPTMAEAGQPELTMYSWNGIFAPARTPAAAQDRLYAAAAAALGDPALPERYAAFGGEVGKGSRQDFVAMVKAEAARWGEVVRAAGIRAD